jgi:hypothetical protein
VSPSPSEEEWRIEPLTPAHEVDRFDSGEESLDGYLRTRALPDMEIGASASRVLVRAGEFVVRGYFTLLNCQIVRAEMERRDRSYGLRRVVPATLLAQIAISSELRGGQGVGELLLMQAFHTAVEAAAISGSYALVLDALNDKLLVWYQGFGLRRLKDEGNPHRLYITMRELRSLDIATPERPDLPGQPSRR